MNSSLQACPVIGTSRNEVTFDFSASLASAPYPSLFPLERPTMSFIPAVVRAAKRSQRLPLPSSRLSPRRSLATVGTEPKFTSPTSEHVTHLRSLLSSKSSLLSTFDESASKEELDGFNVDWMGKYKGQSRVVVKPKNTQEVADVMKYCYEQGIAIVPQGGNTGLVGMSFALCISIFRGHDGEGESVLIRFRRLDTGSR